MAEKKAAAALQRVAKQHACYVLFESTVLSSGTVSFWYRFSV